MYSSEVSINNISTKTLINIRQTVNVCTHQIKVGRFYYYVINTHSVIFYFNTFNIPWIHNRRYLPCTFSNCHHKKGKIFRQCLYMLSCLFQSSNYCCSFTCLLFCAIIFDIEKIQTLMICFKYRPFRTPFIFSTVLPILNFNFLSLRSR